MNDTITPIGKDQTFCFACSPEVPCFNACCRDLNQALTPYDILCLRQFLEMPSADFLTRYTETGTGPRSGLPVVCLRFDDDAERACPFVTATGCSVYQARPASCRTYPLARGLARDRQTGRLTEHWALIREPHCRGFAGGKTQCVDQWIADQQLDRHNRMNDGMLELISLKNRHRPGPLPPTESQRIYTALYDLDAFRSRWLADAGLLKNVDARTREQARSDDTALLQVAMAWVKATILIPCRKDD